MARWRPVVAAVIVALLAGAVLAPRILHIARGLRTVAVASGLPGIVVDEQTGRDFIGGAGPIQVLDTASGALIRTLNLLRRPCCELV